MLISGLRMKADIHPTYYQKAKVKCVCGNEFTVGSTLEKIEVEICSKCHPFYSGEEKIIDTAGRVEKFKARSAAAASFAKVPEGKLAMTDKRAEALAGQARKKTAVTTEKKPTKKQKTAKK